MSVSPFPVVVSESAEVRFSVGYNSIREVPGELSTEDLNEPCPMPGVISMRAGRGKVAGLLAAHAAGRSFTITVTFTMADAGALEITADALAAALSTAESSHAEWLRAA